MKPQSVRLRRGGGLLPQSFPPRPRMSLNWPCNWESEVAEDSVSLPRRQSAESQGGGKIAPFPYDLESRKLNGRGTPCQGKAKEAEEDVTASPGRRRKENSAVE